MKKYRLLIVLLFFATAVAGQDKGEEFHSQIRGAIMMANSHVPQALNGNYSNTIIPAWGIDVDYSFHPHWSVAIQGDIKMQSFEVKDGDTFLQRTDPVSFAGVLHYHFIPRWSLFAGPGYEFEKHENLFIMKVGTEYSFEINKNFEIALNLNYENKEGIYDSWTFGIAFNKKLWEKK